VSAARRRNAWERFATTAFATPRGFGKRIEALEKQYQSLTLATCGNSGFS
jgi:hypothetical protein